MVCGLLVLVVGVVAFLLLDKRRLRKQVPWLRESSWRQEVPIGLSILLVAFVIIGLISTFASP